jgi:serine-type D-Ala-D-Ala carboxypeptidase (penicillin-binding protein 5/6)
VSPRHPRPLAAILLVAALSLPLAFNGLASASSTPPPTPVPPKGSLSPFPTVLHAPTDTQGAPEITAPAAVLADLDSGRLLYARGPDLKRPIASLTKVMTALLVLDAGHLDEVVTVPEDAVFARHDYGASSTLGLEAGERITVRDLLYGMLLGSANDAALALAIHEAGSTQAFVTRMNQRARELGMRDTVFFSPNGLDDRGHSTARDLVTLTGAAYDTAGFATIVDTEVRRMPGPGGTERSIQNRNVMLWLYPGAIGAKTGFTAGAGYCLDATAERDGRRLVAIVLGAPADAFSDAAALLNYGFQAFEHHTFIRLGDPAGEVAIRGGTVPVIAGGTIAGLIPSEVVTGARERITVDPRAAFPPAPGQRVGTLRVTIPGLTVGTVPLMAADLPAPARSGDRPWWMNAAGAVGRAVAQAVGGLMP